LKNLREPINGLTHLAGAILAVLVLAGLVGVAVWSGKGRHAVAFLIFGLSLVALYTSSALYHLLPVSERALQRLRRLDHITIFLLIAGTYTPFCVIALSGAWRWGLLGPVWGIALAGILLKFLWLDAPVWLSTALYLAQGWVALVAVPMLWRAFPPQALLSVAAGGLIYTIGAIIFALKWPTIRRGVFEAHELWHIFVLLGSACHVWTVARYLVPLR
jgi:hemolysin III